MSRIHEALKKAEQERMENPSTLVAPRIEEMPVAPVVSERVVETGPASVVTRAPRVAPEPLTEGGALTHANLLVQCAKPEWKPDKDSILFLDNDSHHEVGMEEFRTLRSRLYRIREHRALKT